MAHGGGWEMCISGLLIMCYAGWQMASSKMALYLCQGWLVLSTPHAPFYIQSIEYDNPCWCSPLWTSSLAGLHDLLLGYLHLTLSLVNAFLDYVLGKVLCAWSWCGSFCMYHLRSV